MNSGVDCLKNNIENFVTTELKIINPIEFNNWDQLLLCHKDHCFFHSSAWAKVLHEAYGYQPLYFTAFSGNEIKLLVPIMIVSSFLTGCRGVSLPFTDMCPVIISDDYEPDDILDFLINYGKQFNWKYLELRTGKYSNHHMCMPTEYFGHVLPLKENQGAIFSGFRDSTKRNIKKATNEGVKVHISNTLDAVREFYRLNCITRKRHGLPPQPYSFFEKIHDNIISQDNGIIILALHNNQAIGGAVFFHFGNKAIFKYGASDYAFQNLRANNLVIWAAIQYYINKKFESLDMGRTSTDNNGLIQFKKGWGVQQKKLYYHKIYLSNHTSATNSTWLNFATQKMISNLPIPLLKLIGKFTYKHIG